MICLTGLSFNTPVTVSQKHFLFQALIEMERICISSQINAGLDLIEAVSVLEAHTWGTQPPRRSTTRLVDSLMFALVQMQAEC